MADHPAARGQAGLGRDEDCSEDTQSRDGTCEKWASGAVIISRTPQRTASKNWPSTDHHIFQFEFDKCTSARNCSDRRTVKIDGE